MTTDDTINPVYCRRCRNQRPCADLDPEGYCAPCRLAMEQEREAAEAARIQAEIARRQAEEAERVARFSAATGMGHCPKCGSTNIGERKIKVGETDGTAQTATCCCGCMFFLPLALLAPFLFRRSRTEIERYCNYCGARWRI